MPIDPRAWSASPGIGGALSGFSSKPDTRPSAYVRTTPNWFTSASGTGMHPMVRSAALARCDSTIRR